ncbi:hypothetical protein [Ktedonobacter robiniae]|uniref:ABC transporter permease n=1 Tax=Ktedonobacter robiniae TaxID=2778365 RepID=A0ABQ3V2V8_9CHLR|nr:hypothetical protein [Ktedonobacter robiniae]GHO59318.1 hypothetical protein KSB_77930 [Ktedonobacter robiniae]
MRIRGDRVRWLFWLRWKMFSRMFTARQTRQITGLVLSLLIIVPLSLGIAAATYLAYRFLPAPANAEVLTLVLSGLFILWLTLPLFEYNVNEGLNVAKLVLFPLSREELMLSLLLSTLFDVPTLGMLLLCLAVIIGWASSPLVVLMSSVTMLIFFAQLIGCSQLVLALLGRVMQSRRFRDVSILLVGLFSSSCYLIQQLVFRGLGARQMIHALYDQAFSRYLQWLPPGMAAQVILQATRGNWLLSFVWLLPLLAITLLVLYLWQIVVERALTATEGAGAVRVRRAPASQRALATAAPTMRSRLVHWLPEQTRAIALKDLKYYRRDPMLLRLIIQSLISMVVLIVITLFSPTRFGDGLQSSWTVLAVPFYALFFVTSFSHNVLGLERQSLALLFIFPIKPQHLLLGKNLIAFVLGTLNLLIVILLGAYVAHSWEYVLPALTIGLAGLGIVLGCGNLSSVYFPSRMPQEQRGYQASAITTSQENGCLRLIQTSALFLLMLVLLTPVAAALLLPVFFHVLWLWSLSIPASLVYSWLLYFITTHLAAQRMLQKAPEILRITTARE